MDGSNVAYGEKKQQKSSSKRKQRYRAMLKRNGMNEHHRQPRCRQGGRGHGDLNIVKVGIEIHRCFHALFNADPPEKVIIQVNVVFSDEPEYLVSVPTEYFSAFHRYFTNLRVLKWIGMSGYGLTWGHLFLYGTQEDLHRTFRSGQHLITKHDPNGAPLNRWGYLFETLKMSMIAYELTKYWLPLDQVVIAIPKEHRSQVNDFLVNLSALKKRL